ncbi:protein-export chaperone SecB [Hyphomicrobium sp.]|uniref:protein-export chaperone SecB n=1 Tax=Hyphomicrobium sp. TaxID=82 RepID=UPI001DDF20A2|nr:protein-export chaperone SecB [Hyphomicrobium sp.]MBY0560652.1 protein-export chaperone SecB [Hyphomicrobium sp.]
MAEQGNNGNGAASTQKPEGQVAIQAKIVNQYIKDLSFENPNVAKLIVSAGDQPTLKVEVNVGAQKMEDDLFETSIEFKATATNNIGTIYVIETVYAGLLKIESMPEGALEPFLLISAPAMIFPFLRRLVADVTREGGFPPLLLDPIDFGDLYRRRQQQRSQGTGRANA